MQCLYNIPSDPIRILTWLNVGGGGGPPGGGGGGMGILDLCPAFECASLLKCHEDSQLKKQKTSIKKTHDFTLTY